MVSQAIQVLKEEDKESADLYNLAGLLRMQDDDQIEALKAFKKATTVDEKHTDANLNIAFISIRFRDYETAEKSLDIALKDPKESENYEAVLAMGVAKRGLKKYAESFGRPIPTMAPAVMRALMGYPFNGNVRELENIVERLTVFCDGELVELDDLPRKIIENRLGGSDLPVDLPEEGLDLRKLLNAIEERLIRQALQRTGWNKNQAASLLQMNRTTLVEKLKKRNMLTPP